VVAIIIKRSEIVIQTKYFIQKEVSQSVFREKN